MTRLDSNVQDSIWTERKGGFPVLPQDRPIGPAVSPPNVGEVERWGSIAVGALLVLAGLSRGRVSGLVMGLTGAGLLHRGVTGSCQTYRTLGVDTARHNPATAIPAQEGVKVEYALQINAPANQLFGYWRDVENLPRVMRHLKQVDALDRQRSHWVAGGPLGVTVEWDAEVFNERENELIAWRSLPGGDIETAGSVHFRDIGNGRTELNVSMKYNPPGGKAGAAIASVLGSGLAKELAEDLQRFKLAMESNSSPSTDSAQSPS